MTDSLIDSRESSDSAAAGRFRATKIAFPIKTLSYDHKSLMMLHSTKVEPVLSCKFKKEEAADFRKAINEKMKDLEVKNRKSSDLVAAGRFRAYVSRFGTGAKEIDKELRQHFENCGRIQGISVNEQAGYAHIDFTSLESLLKALQQDTTSFCGRPLTPPLYISRVITNNFTFRAAISGLDTGARELDVLHYFKICGGDIEDIQVMSRGVVYIDFASLADLDKDLELDHTKVGDRLVTIAKVNSCTRFRVEIRGFDTGAGAEEALREHFKECGRIEGISVSVKAEYACIDFANRNSLFKALDFNNTRVGDRLVTVQPRDGHAFHSSELTACIRWFSVIALDDVRSHFEKCGVIVGIRHTGGGSAEIDFTNLDSLNKALKLDKSFIGNHGITVKKLMYDEFLGGY